MGLWKKLGKLASQAPSEEELEARRQKEERERPYIKLLSNFELKDLKDICEKVYGTMPQNTFFDGKGHEHSREMNRYVYESHIIDNISFSQVKQFALRHKIVSPSYFPKDSDAIETPDEFENLINSIHRGFEPEKITNEEHLESQLTIYLKAKFPNMKVERQQYTKRNEKLDIVVDDKYVFEIKVPRNRTHLRNLTAQLEEYKEQFPNLCVVIADVSKMESDENSLPIESNLSQIIKEYVDIYKTKLNVPSIIKEISTRK